MTHEEFVRIIEDTNREIQQVEDLDTISYHLGVLRRAVEMESAFHAVETGLAPVGDPIPSRQEIFEFLRSNGVNVVLRESVVEQSVEPVVEDVNHITPPPSSSPVDEEVEYDSIDISNLPLNSNLSSGYSPVGSIRELEYFRLILMGNNPNGWRITREHQVSSQGRGAWQVVLANNFGNRYEFWMPTLWYNRFLEATGREPLPIPSHNEIQPNSGSLTIDESTSRFSGAVWYGEIQRQKVTLAGVGGIGSYVGFLLGRLKPRMLFIYDPDVVETVNMSGQLYSTDDLGMPKVTALARMVKKYANYNAMTTYSTRFTNESWATDVMICGFDNMKARQLFFMKWRDYVLSKPEEERSKCLFIDGRLAAEEFQVITISGTDIRAMREYENKWLFSDARADVTVCSYKQTTFMANMIASVMVNTFVNFVANLCDPIFPRDIPFIITYDASTMFFKTEM